jgi:Flp pilus assembly pilin Flp
MKVLERTVMQSPLAVAMLKKVAGARLRWDEDGQDLLEYGMLVALIALVAIGAVGIVGNAVNELFWQNIANNF